MFVLLTNPYVAATMFFNLFSKIAFMARPIKNAPPHQNLWVDHGSDRAERLFFS